MCILLTSINCKNKRLEIKIEVQEVKEVQEIKTSA